MRLARAVGFDTREIEELTAQQGPLESQDGHDFLVYSRPTEESVGAAFEHTAVLAERPENRRPLRQIGRLFGRLVFLLDAYRDLDEDRAAGHFNALATAYPESERRGAAVRLFSEAHGRIRELVSKLRLPRPELARKLLVGELGYIGAHTLGVASCAAAGAEMSNQEEERNQGSFCAWCEFWADCCSSCCSGEHCCDGCCCGDCCDGCCCDCN